MKERDWFLGYVEDDVRYVSVTVRLSVELQALAKERGVTMTELVNEALEVGFTAALEGKVLKGKKK